MSGKDSILEGLFSDSGGFDEKRTAEVLKRIITLHRSTYAVTFKRDNGLKEEDKVLTFLVVKKLLKSQGVVETAEVSAKEIKEKTGVKSGTVDAAIKKLREESVIAGSGSNYEILAHEVDEIVDRLEKRAAKG